MSEIVSKAAGMTMTDAMVRCMQQPGALAVAFVEIKTGLAIAGEGIENIDFDRLTPALTAHLLFYLNPDPINPGLTCTPQSEPNGTVHCLEDILITAGDRIHMMYPLSRGAQGLYLYLALKRSVGSTMLGRRCFREIDDKLLV